MKLCRLISVLLLTTLLITCVSISPSATHIIEEDDSNSGAVTSVLFAAIYDFNTHTESVAHVPAPNTTNDIPAETEPIITPNVLVPPDLSSLIPENEYDIYPNSAVCKLAFKYTDSSGTTWGSNGTAFIVGKRIVLTAAHCVYGEFGWMDRVCLIPHAASTMDRWYVLNHGKKVIKALIPYAYKNNPTTENDWAVLVVEDDVETGNGKFPLTTEVPAINGNALIISYPAGNFTFSPGSIMAIYDKKVKYTCDTLGGSSGGPVYRIQFNGSVTSYPVFAIHNVGYTGSAPSNGGARIDSFIIKIVGDYNNSYA